MTSVLDLPISQQKQLAKEEGISHEQWVKETKELLQASRKFVDEISSTEADMSSEQVAHMQSKMDSGNPPG